MISDESISEIRIQGEKFANKRKGFDKNKIDTIAEEDKDDDSPRHKFEKNN